MMSLHLPPDLHAGDAFVPALDDLDPGTELEIEWLLAIDAAVELGAVLEPARVVDGPRYRPCFATTPSPTF